ncbi:helix-turn-helix domain-containing protein [Sphingobacterium thalpophilum]|uniref:Helix-turn-helix domain n=1 Tax=Sphingobacterium thalpophilum TaxID=259 RepID=A0A4U9VFB5_9SPHI|nr:MULTISPECIES: helix-turn-helix transcriptional regulator [Sphingobacterium]MCW8312833.1 helix-turn-helix domain-containing protein [Sphingobacterium sp. InxBP1]VTR41731.1 Helix-turn-helix domain [Sphingobacterium thalpophilum]
MTDNDKQKLASIGLRFRARRNELYYSIRDVSNLTGISVGTLNGIERGKDLTLSNFLLLCSSLQIQPKTFFQEDIKFGAPYSLPPDVQERITINKKLDKLIYDSDFFDKPKRVSEVLKELDIDSVHSNKFSVQLTAYCEKGALESEQRGNFKFYRKRT